MAYCNANNILVFPGTATLGVNPSLQWNDKSASDLNIPAGIDIGAWLQSLGTTPSADTLASVNDLVISPTDLTATLMNKPA